MLRKSLFVLIMFTLSLVALAQRGWLAPEGEPGETYYAPFPVSITLDGAFDDWEGVRTVFLQAGVGGPGMTFAAAADDTYLYLMGDVIDDNIITGQHGQDYWNEDSIEFYINATGDLSRTSYTSGVAQITLPPLNIGVAPEEAVIGGINGADSQAQVVTVATERGWAVEVAIPLETDVWSITPQHEAAIGFQVHLNAASENNRDTKLIWSVFDTSDISYQNPSVFGQLIFYEVSQAATSGEYRFTSQLDEDGLIDDFENGIWIGADAEGAFMGLVPQGGALAIRQVLSDSDLALPDQRGVADNVLAIEGGLFSHIFTDGNSYNPQDWSAYNALGMWLYGTGSGEAFNIIALTDMAHTATISDDFSGWRYVIAPFAQFSPALPEAPSNVRGYGVQLPQSVAETYIDDVRLFYAENTSAIQFRDAPPESSFLLDEGIGWDSREWELVWADEFDAEANTPIDPASWTCEIGGHGWGNNELEFYTSNLSNVSHDGVGNLVITAREAAGEGYNCWYGQCAYTSARCITRDKVEFTYGRVEGRIKIPRGQGIWPAFWMLGANFPEVGWPNSGEIDIMENIGSEPRTVHGTVHGPGYSGAGGIGHGLELAADLADDYHVYAIDWDPNVIRWYIDGQLYGTVSVNDLGSREWVFDHDFFLLINVAVGGAWPGYPDESTEFPQQMLIDYIRVYQLAGDE
ncbi:MAG: glycosyl hydrolase family protein [Chloroflexi bacterium]|nr:MAG: glycosyl hydrolase family protein [Chloroflexota bacterium]